MKGAYRCSLLTLSFALLLTVFSPLFSTVASAASPEDDDYTQVSNVIYGAQNYYGITCGYEDITNSYVSLLQDPDNWAYAGEKDSYYPEFMDAINNGGSWSVSQVQNGYVGGSGSGYGYHVEIYFNPNPDEQTVSFNGAGDVVYDTQPGTKLIQIYNSQTLIGSGGCDPKIRAFPGGATMSNQLGVDRDASPVHQEFRISNLFTTGAQVNYPSDYEGIVIPENPEGEKEHIRPEFKYSVENKDVTAEDINETLPTFEPDEGYTFKGYQVEWSLFKCGEWTEVGSICGDSELVQPDGYDIVKQDGKFTADVKEYGDYMLEGQYLVEQCYRYPSYPATPDNCFYVDLEQEMPDYEFTPTYVHLDINGQSIVGDTRDGDCDESGYCSAPSPYEDCSTYGLDIVGGLGCIMRNFGVWLFTTLRNLFIPSGEFLESYWASFTEKLNQSLGFIYQSIALVVGTLGGMIGAAATSDCTFTPSGGDFFGAPVSFNMCKMSQIFPAGWVILQGLVIGSTVFGLVFAFNRKYHEVLEAR